MDEWFVISLLKACLSIYLVLYFLRLTLISEWKIDLPTSSSVLVHVKSDKLSVCINSLVTILAIVYTYVECSIINDIKRKVFTNYSRCLPSKCMHSFITISSYIEWSRTVLTYPFSFTAYTNDLKGGQISNEQLTKYEWHRLLSFESFPIESLMSPIRLAQAGFFYVGQGQEVKCFCCGMKHSMWTKDETALEVHRRISPNCIFIRDGDSGNIPIHIPHDQSEHHPVIREPIPTHRRRNNSEGTTRATALDIISNTDSVPSTDQHFSMNEERTRLLTFESFPPDANVRGLRLAQAGFYYTGKCKIVKCFSCGVTHGQWSDTEREMEVHRRISPGCAFIRGIESHNVEIQEGSLNYTESHRHPEYKTFLERLNSFKGKYLPFPPEEMARVGFFFAGGRDSVRCFHCGVGLRNWEETDDPLHEHNRWSPACIHAQQLLRAENESLKKEIKDERDKLKKQLICKVCLDKQADIVFLPCGHFVACQICATGMNRCPVCRQKIKGSVRTYIS